MLCKEFADRLEYPCRDAEDQEDRTDDLSRDVYSEVCSDGEQDLMLLCQLTDGYAHICIDCVKELFAYYKEKDSQQEAVKIM